MDSTVTSAAIAGKPKLLDQVRDVCRFKHYSIRTEQTYVDWIKRYIYFHGKRHPKDLTATQPSTQKIAIPAAALQKATRARLRLVVERLAEGEGVALINGKEYRLPKAVTPENAPWIRDLPVAVADLKEQTEVKFQVTSPAHAGYRLATASVLVETE